jgi:RNA polymerase sigma-70 factor (ECF subfamily)
VIIEEIFDKHQKSLVRSVAAWCRSAELAEDAVQQAFLTALSRWELMSNLPEKAGVSWLYVTARNRATDMLRKQRRLTFLEDDRDWEDPRGDMADSQIMEEALERLPEKQRDIVALRYFSGYSSGEIGKLLGIPAATVRYHLAAAMKQLRSYYNGEEPK